MARYLALRVRLESPRSASLTISLGCSFAACCPACRSTSRLEGKGGVPRCGRCGAVWPSERVEVLKGQVQTSRRGGGGLERHLADLADVGVHLGRLRLWERRLLLLAAATGLPLARLADEAQARWPRCRHAPWTPWKVRTMLDAARRDLEARLARAGLLA